VFSVRNEKNCIYMLFYKTIFLHHRSSISNHYSIIPQQNNMFGLNWYGVNKYSFAVKVAFLHSQQFTNSHTHFLIFVESEESCSNKLSVATCDSSARHYNHTHTHKLHSNRVNAEFSNICPNFGVARSEFVRSRIAQ